MLVVRLICKVILFGPVVVSDDKSRTFPLTFMVSPSTLPSVISVFSAPVVSQADRLLAPSDNV